MKIAALYLSVEVHPSDLFDLSMLCKRHGSSIARLQLFAEVCRLGFGYVPVIPAVKNYNKVEISVLDHKVLDYAESQEGNLYDLHNMCAVRMWGILEAFVGDVCRFLIIKKAASFSDRASKVKVPLELLQNLDFPDGVEELLLVLENSIDAPMKLGVGRFEGVLSLLGAGGAVDPKVRDILFQCSKIRNCVVHNDSIVDSSLASAIPDLKDQIGGRVGVTWYRARMFLNAVCWYMVEVQIRLIPEKISPKQREELVSTQQQLFERLEKCKESPGQIPFPDPSTPGAK